MTQCVNVRMKKVPTGARFTFARLLRPSPVSLLGSSNSRIAFQTLVGVFHFGDFHSDAPATTQDFTGFFNDLAYRS